MFPVDDMVKVVTRPSVSYVLALLPRITVTGSHLYIRMDRGIVKENYLSLDDIATP